jgi:hypothetical protein
MSEQQPKADDAQILQILINEHTNLQAIRSATVFEANGRTTLFLGAVSSSIVALAFIGQMSEMGSAFLLFALILLPSLLFLGIVTFVRVYQTGIEDMIASRGINRIRHYYTEIAPGLDDYFILSTHDDMQGMLQNMGAREGGWWQLFVSTHGMVGVLNSILAAVFAGLLTATFLSATVPVTIIIGVIIFVISILLHFRYQSHTFDVIHATLKVHFPSEKAPEHK